MQVNAGKHGTKAEAAGAASQLHAPQVRRAEPSALECTPSSTLRGLSCSFERPSERERFIAGQSSACSVNEARNGRVARVVVAAKHNTTT